VCVLHLLEQRWENLTYPEAFGEPVKYTGKAFHEGDLFFARLGGEVRTVEKVESGDRE
jgi:hypothetical protein